MICIWSEQQKIVCKYIKRVCLYIWEKIFIYVTICYGTSMLLLGCLKPFHWNPPSHDHSSQNVLKINYLISNKIFSRTPTTIIPLIEASFDSFFRCKWKMFFSVGKHIYSQFSLRWFTWLRSTFWWLDKICILDYIFFLKTF